MTAGRRQKRYWTKHYPGRLRLLYHGQFRNRCLHRTRSARWQMGCRKAAWKVGEGNGKFVSRLDSPKFCGMRSRLQCGHLGYDVVFAAEVSAIKKSGRPDTVASVTVQPLSRRLRGTGTGCPAALVEKAVSELDLGRDANLDRNGSGDDSPACNESAGDRRPSRSKGLPAMRTNSIPSKYRKEKGKGHRGLSGEPRR